MYWGEIKRDQFGNEYVSLQDALSRLNALTEQLQSQADSGSWLPVVVGAGLALMGLAILLSMFFIVQQQTAVIVERFGKFSRIARPGLRFRIPLIEQCVWEADLRIQSLELTVETKTKDNDVCQHQGRRSIRGHA